MKKFFFFIWIGITLSAFSSYSQTTGAGFNQIASTKTGTTDWVKFNTDIKTDASILFSNHYEAFGLSTNDMMHLKTVKTDNINMTHYRYIQKHKGIPVWGAEYILHEKNGKLVSGNGKLVNDLMLNTTPQLTSATAIQKAIEYTAAEKYMWEDIQNENLIKQIKNSSDASFYPKAELLIADEKLSRKAENYKLVYKVDVYAEKPMSRKDIFVDAITGEVLFTVNRIHHTDVPGVAETKYSGTQNIITDSVQPDLFRLRSNAIGGGVETYNMNKGTNYGSAVDFTDTDNYWNNFNANQDEAATDAHFATQQTYKYYYEKFGRLSYDDNNAKLISYVHYDNNYANAFWNGFYMTYGDGNGTSYSALTSLDVCAHEITHAVTEHSANLIYKDEPGALNEAFSDIFGAAVEFYATPSLADWFIGEDFDLQGNGFRSMSDPKASQLPDTYHGQYWQFNNVFDYGGVHTNCGVGAHWFYILAEGKSGTNDNGHSYNVTAIGIEKAEQIAYRMLTAYLVTSSQYIDARQAGIWAAEDLYGQCSQEAVTVSQAWHAVGVGFPISDYDLWMSHITYPKTACGLNSTESIQARLIYNGCNAVFNTGDTIPVCYKINDGAIVNDTIILSFDLNGGDTLDFIFNTPADFSAIGTHKIDCWVDYPNDNEKGNDSLFNYTFENKIQQNIDMRVHKVTAPVSNCHLDDEIIKIEVQFLGCDSIVSGDTIQIGYRVNNGTPVFESTVIPQTLFPGDVFSYEFLTPHNFSDFGNHQIKAWTDFTPDTLNANDTILTYTIKNPKALTADTIGFEEPNLAQLILIETTPYSNAFSSYVARNTGTRGMLMTGGNVADYIDYLELPTQSNMWNINEFLSAKVNYCVDATTWSSCNMRFDLKQTHGGTLYSQYLGQGDYTIASNLRILINGVQLGNTYNPTTPASDPYLTHFINLDAYAGTKFTLTFETRNIAKDTSIMGMPFKLDNAYMDNVCFSEHSQQNTDNLNNFLSFEVYPNPFNDFLTLKYDTDKSVSIEIVVTDIIGKEIYNEKWTVDTGSNYHHIQMKNKPAGVYVLKISDKSGYVSKKIIKL